MYRGNLNHGSSEIETYSQSCVYQSVRRSDARCESVQSVTEPRSSEEEERCTDHGRSAAVEERS